jgi:hypothetical protein
MKIQIDDSDLQDIDGLTNKIADLMLDLVESSTLEEMQDHAADIHLALDKIIGITKGMREVTKYAGQ